MAVELLSLSNPVFAGYVFYATILALKCVLMSVATARYRLAKRVFPTAEDYGKKDGEMKKVADPDVERVRSAHLNDMENVYPFFTIGFLFVLTNPSASVALWLFRVFTGARVMYTVFYLNAMRARSPCFVVGLFINIIMSVMILKSFY
eukprot:gene12120-13371_t